MDGYEFKERVAKTEYLVEADTDHSLHLWCMWSEEAKRTWHYSNVDGPRFEWVQHHGCGVHVGTLDDRPIMLTLTWNEIGGALVCFYHSSSQLVDHKMIDDWLAANFKDVKRTNVTNFHHVVHYVEKRDPQKVVDLLEAKRPLSREAVECYEQHGALTTRLVSDHAIERYRRERDPDRRDPATDAVMAKLGDALGRLDRVIGSFTAAVWGGWLKDYYRGHGQRGHEANAGNVNLLVWGAAGRVCISLRQRQGPDDEHLTLIGSDTEGDGAVLGIQGISFNQDAVVDLVQEATRLSETLEDDIRPNPNVGIG